MLPSRSIENLELDSILESSSSSQQSALKSLIGLTSQFRIFVDQHSPFHTAPEIVKQILLKAKDSKQCLNCDEIDLAPLQFEPRITQNHKCLHMFEKKAEKFYICLECTGQNQIMENVIICQYCFQSENHVGHSYYTEMCRFRECICSCGFNEKFSDKYVCNHHGEVKNTDVKLDEKQRQDFLNIFTSLLEVACYQNQGKELFNIVCKKIQELCQNSLYYCKLTMELFKKQSKYIKDEPDGPNSKNFLTILLQAFAEITDVIVHLCANKDIQFQLAMFIIKNYNRFELYQSQTGLDTYALDIIFSYDILEKILLQQKLAILLLFDRYELYTRKKRYRKTSKNLFLTYLKNNIETVPDDKQQYLLGQLIKSQYVITNSQIGWLCLRYCVDKYPKKKKKLAHEVIMRSIIVITKADHERVLGFRNQLKDEGVDLGKFEGILKSIVQDCRNYLYNKRSSLGNQTPVSMITLLLLIKSSENNKKLIDLFWKSLLRQQDEFIEIVAEIYQIVSAVVWSETHFLLLHNIFSKISLDQSSSSGRQEQMKKFYTRFLYLKQKIQRQELISMFQKHLIQPSELGKILTDSCTYTELDEIFTYNSSQLDKKFQDKFFFETKQAESPSIVVSIFQNNQIYYGFQEKIIVGKDLQNYQKELLQFMMQSGLVKILNSFAPKKIKNDQQKCGYLYIFTLILINGFTDKSKGGELRKKIQEIKDISLKREINEYARGQVYILLNLRLFGIKQDEAGQDKVVELVSMIRNRSCVLSKLKKERDQYLKRGDLYSEWKSMIKSNKYKGENIDIMINQSEQMNKNQQADGQICLACHKQYQKEDELVYLAHINANSNLSKAIYGQQNKANIIIKTCFHTLHLSCFINSHKNSIKNTFLCPSCARATNCFLVKDYKKINKQTKLIFQNVLISALVHDFGIYDVENSFMIFFRCMVEIKGLKSLSTSAYNPTQIKIRQKNNNFVEQLMLTIYQITEAIQQQDYKRGIEKFINSLSGCKNQGIKLIQVIIAQTLRSKIVHKQEPKFSIDEFVRLRNLLQQEQFQMIKSSAQSILQQKLHIPQQQQQQQLIPAQPKQSLKLTLLQPPPDSSHFPKFILNNQCLKNHQRKIDYWCLICGKGLCQECSEDRQELIHYGMAAYINIEEYTVYLHNSTMNTETSIYYNDLKVAYNERQPKQMVEQLYKLDMKKYMSLVNQFLE